MQTVFKILDLTTGALMAGEFDTHQEAVRHAAYLNRIRPIANGTHYTVREVRRETYSESDANRALLETAGRNTDARDAERAAILRKLGV